MTVKVRKTRSVNPSPSPYLFRNIPDGAFYLVAYFALPLYSVIDYINRKDAAILFTALSCCFGVIYDCYSRYGGCGKDKAIKLWIIGLTNAALLVYTVFSIQAYMNKGVLLCPYIYIWLIDYSACIWHRRFRVDDQGQYQSKEVKRQ